MHRCSSSQGNMVGPCSCGNLFHSQSNSFSMLFSKPFDHYNDHDQAHHPHHDMYSFASPSSSVDCTLSLGTPSTRLSTTTEDYYDDNNSNNKQHQRMRHERRTDSCVSNFCWDLLQPNNKQQTTSSHKNGGRSGSNTNNSSNDPLLARRCANCDTTSTPLWRNGPRGPKSLCNACGIRFKKEERRAAATSTANGAASGVVIEPSHVFNHHNNPWNIHHQHSQAQKMPCLGNEFRFMDDENHEPADSTGISFLSWRLNVTDRPSLVHDFTR